MAVVKPNLRKGLFIAFSQKTLTASLSAMTVEILSKHVWWAMGSMALLWGFSFVLTIVDEKAIFNHMTHLWWATPPGERNEP